LVLKVGVRGPFKKLDRSAQRLSLERERRFLNFGGGKADLQAHRGGGRGIRVKHIRGIGEE